VIVCAESPVLKRIRMMKARIADHFTEAFASE
jgi:hypothetical protein